jgi:hypothetical protein
MLYILDGSKMTTLETVPRAHRKAAPDPDYSAEIWMRSTTASGPPDAEWWSVFLRPWTRTSPGCCWTRQRQLESDGVYRPSAPIAGVPENRKRLPFGGRFIMHANMTAPAAPFSIRAHMPRSRAPSVLVCGRRASPLVAVGAEAPSMSRCASPSAPSENMPSTPDIAALYLCPPMSMSVERTV